jgi:hypothetical protein
MLGVGALAALVGGELFRPAPRSAEVMAGEIGARFGASLAAVLFYGSCLRRGSDEGVLDFYALVDDYGAAYGAGALARANAVLPPNVFYLERDCDGTRLRAKYAVFSLRDFARAVRPEAIRVGTWARFCQPALAVYRRDAEASAALVDALCTAVKTAVWRGLALLPGDGDTRAGSAESLWRTVFGDTYASELRPESRDRAGDIYAADPARYGRALAAALESLESEGRLRIARSDAQGFEIACPGGALRETRRRIRVRRPLAKAVATLQLLKSAATFGDWLPYALWKLERHTGTHLEPTERQRRHPFVFGWPLIARVLWRRELR